jgi:V8-like Glu-specific endopeptidase
VSSLPPDVLAGAEAAEDPTRPLKGETETPFVGWPAVRETAALGGRLLDAWHATYSSDVTAALLERDRSLVEAAVEKVIDRDDRERVTDTSAFPWRCICALVMTAHTGKRYIGTGWLAGPKTVITAGHCVYMHAQGGWPESIAVYPAGNGSRGDAIVSRVFRSVTGWTERKSSDYDYGAILLPEATPVGNFGYSTMTDAQLAGRLVSVYGYPSDKPPGTLWGHYRRLRRVLPEQLVYNIATIGGQSGAPVWDKNGDERSVVGIHTSGDATGNFATRITDDVFDNIEAWKAASV